MAAAGPFGALVESSSWRWAPVCPQLRRCPERAWCWVPLTAEHVPELRRARPEGLPGAQVEQLRSTRMKPQALSLRAVWAARSSQSDQEGGEA